MDTSIVLVLTLLAVTVAFLVFTLTFDWECRAFTARLPSHALLEKRFLFAKNGF